MKNRINAVLVILLVIFGIAVAGLSIEKKNISTELNQREETIAQLRNDNAELSNRLYKTMATKIETATKIIQAQKETAKIDNEATCKTLADKYFAQMPLDSDLTRSTYRSHWNLSLKACILEVTVNRTDNTGKVIPMAIAHIDITNGQVRNNCVMEASKGDGLSCESSIFTTFREGLMSQ